MQIVHSSRRGAREIEHIGSAHTEADLEVLKAAARQRLVAGQGELDLQLQPGDALGAPLPITSSRMAHLWDALVGVYGLLGFEAAAGGDEVFRDLVLARIVEPASKLDTPRVLEEIGVACASYPTINRRLRTYASEAWRAKLASAGAARTGLGPATLVLYDVTTLYFETDEGDGFRESGFSKERRLEPQITVGLLTDRSGCPLRVDACEGYKAETTSMLPTIQAFMNAYDVPELTVVADAGMVSAGNQQKLEEAGLSFILGARIPEVPYAVKAWRQAHPGEEVVDQQVFVQQWPAGPKDKRRDQVIYYQYRTDRARRTLRGIDEQVAKAENAVAGKVAVKRNRFVKLTGASKSVNRDLEAKARSLAGYKGYVTNLSHCPDGTPISADFVIGAYHQLWRIEQSFRMSKHDLQARPVYARKRDSIEAHLSIVFAALAVTRYIEATTDWSIRRFVRTARRYRTITIQAGTQTITAADPLPDDLRAALNKIKSAGPH